VTPALLRHVSLWNSLTGDPTPTLTLDAFHPTILVSAAWWLVLLLV